MAPTLLSKIMNIWYIIIITTSCLSPRSGSRTAGLNGAVRRRWTPAPWSSTTHPCCPLTARHQFTPAWVRWATRSPWTLGCPLLSPVLHQSTASPASWVQLKACSPATPVTASSTPLLILIPILMLTLTLIRPWARGCKAWLLHPTSVQPRTLKNTLWRTWTSAARVLLHWEWKPRNTSSLWTRPGNPCD